MTYASLRLFQTNDDGYSSPGLVLLYRRILEELNGVTTVVVAPETNQSVSSQRLTISGRMRLKEYPEIGEKVYSLAGTPADCSIMALDFNGVASDPPPSLVISGINHGGNMSHDVLYSGTFAAARQAAMLGYPSIATSLTGRDFSDENMSSAVSSTIAVIKQLLPHVRSTPSNISRTNLVRQPHNQYEQMEDCPEDVHAVLFDAFRHGDIVLNINTPKKWSGKFKSTSLAARAYREVVNRDADEMWLGGSRIDEITPSTENSDVIATRNGYCSVTTLQTWPETHPFRVPDFIMKAALKEGRSGLPLWIERATKLEEA